MPPVHEPPRPASAPDPALKDAFQWLLALGFPAEVAAASLLPEVFTNEPAVPESRPGRLHLHGAV